MRTAVSHQLLLADLALERGLADPASVAAALEGSLATTAKIDLAEALAARGALDEGQAAALRRAAAALGAPAAALGERGGTARLASLLPHAGDRLRAALADWGIDARASLRSMPKGRYVDYLPVGKGGMGIVFLARDVELHREVALKVIHLAPPGAAGDVTPMDPSGLAWPPESVRSEGGSEGVTGQLEARFLQEAWITGSMSHPGIVPVYELGQTELGVPYYTMRFIEGRRTLADAIDEVKGQPLEHRLPLLDAFLDVCDTMRYAHSRGVLHRDLKPSNVVLGEYGEVVVVDWGLARIQDRPDHTIDSFRRRVEAFRAAADLHTQVSVLGTPGYMSPEAAAGDAERVDTRSDVYSLSAVLFEILTGRLPIPVTNIGEYLDAVRVGAVADAREVSPEVPGPLATLCAEGLRLDPRERLGSVEALASEIRRWRTEAAVDREVDALIREAEAALTAACDATGAAVLPHLELASHASRRIQALRADSPQAARFLGQIDEIRATHLADLARAARSTLLKRVSVAAVVLAAVVAVGVSFVLEQRRKEAADARAAATLSRERAERVMTFMVEDLQDDLEPLGRLDLLTKIGSRARAYYADQPLAGASRTSLVNRATALRRLGDAYRLRGDLPQALEAYGAAAAAGARLRQSSGSDLDGAFQIALAGAREGEILVLQGLTSRGRDVLLTHQAELTRLSSLRPGDTELMTAQSEVAARLVGVFFGEGRPEEGLRLAERALSLAEGAARTAGGGALRLRRTVLKRRLLLVAARYGPESGQRVERLLGILGEMQALGRQAPQDVRWQTLAVAARLQVAGAYTARGLDEKAEQELRETLPSLERLVAKDSTNLAWESHLATALRQHGDALLALKRPAEALTLYKASYRRMRSLSSADPTNAAWLNRLITLCDRHVAAGASPLSPATDVDRWRQEAVRYARQLLARDKKNARHRHISAYTMHTYARWLKAREKSDAALDLSAEAEAVLVDLLQENPDNREAAVLLGWNANLRVRICTEQGAPAEARRASETPERVLSAVLAHRPDYWMVRVERVRLRLARADSLAAAGDVTAASALRQAVAATLRAGLAQKTLSEAGRAQLEALYERATPVPGAAGEPK